MCKLAVGTAGSSGVIAQSVGDVRRIRATTPGLAQPETGVSDELVQLLYGETNLFQDVPERSSAYLSVQRNNDGDPLFGIVQEDVTASLPVDDKTDSAKRLDNLPAGEGFAQRETSTSCSLAPGGDSISLSFSNPSM